MRAGILNEVLIFFGATKSTDRSGEVKTDWSPIYSCRAYKRKSTPTNDRDGINAREIFNGYNLVFQVRYNPIIKDSQRILYMGEMYKIIPPLDYQRADNTYIITVTRADV